MFLESKQMKNTLFRPIHKNEDFSTISIYIYNNDKLINKNHENINEEVEIKNFNSLKDLLLNFIKSSNEFSKVFFWHYINK